MAALKDAVKNERGVATELATDAARHIELQFQQAFSPTIALEIFIQRVPVWSILVSEFPWIASQLLQKVLPGMISNLQLAPNMVVQAIYPLAGNEAAMGHDLLADAARREDTLLSLASGNLTVAGPYKLLQGGYGVVLRKAVFISGVDQNTTFGANVSAAQCPPGLCWQPLTRSRVWGFAQGLARVDGLLEGHDARMRRLLQYGPWQLTRLLPNGTESLLAASGPDAPCLRNSTSPASASASSASASSSAAASPSLEPAGSHCVSVDVLLPNARWRLYLARAGGWAGPQWRGLMALVVAGSFAVAALMFCLLLSGHRHRALLRAMFPDKVLQPLRQGKNFSEEFESVTILFSDIVSYTAISSALRPIEVAEMLNELYCCFDDLVDKNGCYKVETIGDAFMVVGGCPVAEPASVAAERVAHMALDMLAAAAAFTSSGGHRLRIRIGIASGPAAAAVIGRKMPRYCLFGDTVNLASRMESSSEPMRIQLSPSAAAALRSCASAASLRLTPRGPQHVKGKGAMECFFLEHVDGTGGAAAAAAAAAAAGQAGLGQVAVGLSTCGSLAGSERAAAASASASPSRKALMLLRSDASISLCGGGDGGGGDGSGGDGATAAAAAQLASGASGGADPPAPPGVGARAQQSSADGSGGWASLHLCRFRKDRALCASGGGGGATASQLASGGGGGGATASQLASGGGGGGAAASLLASGGGGVPSVGLSLYPLPGRPSQDQDSAAGDSVLMGGSSGAGLVLGARPSGGTSGGSAIRWLMRGGSSPPTAAGAGAGAVGGGVLREGSLVRHLEPPRRPSGKHAMVTGAGDGEFGTGETPRTEGGPAAGSSSCGSWAGRGGAPAGATQAGCGAAADGAAQGGGEVSAYRPRAEAAHLPSVPSTSPLPSCCARNGNGVVQGANADPRVGHEVVSGLASASFSSPLALEDRTGGKGSQGAS